MNNLFKNELTYTIEFTDGTEEFHTVISNKLHYSNYEGETRYIYKDELIHIWNNIDYQDKKPYYLDGFYFQSGLFNLNKLKGVSFEYVDGYFNIKDIKNIKIDINPIQLNLEDYGFKEILDSLNPIEVKSFFNDFCNKFSTDPFEV